MNKRGCLTLLSIVLAIGLLPILLGCFFAVYQTEQVIITQFGKPVGEPITDPGLQPAGESVTPRPFSFGSATNAVPNRVWKTFLEARHGTPWPSTI